MEYLWCWILGIAVGSVVTYVAIIFKTAFGTLIVDRSDPEKDRWRLDIHKLADIHKKKFVWLKVDTKTELSQK